MDIKFASRPPAIGVRLTKAYRQSLKSLEGKGMGVTIVDTCLKPDDF